MLGVTQGRAAGGWGVVGLQAMPAVFQCLQVLVFPIKASLPRRVPVQHALVACQTNSPMAGVVSELDLRRPPDAEVADTLKVYGLGIERTAAAIRGERYTGIAHCWTRC